MTDKLIKKETKTEETYSYWQHVGSVRGKGFIQKLALIKSVSMEKDEILFMCHVTQKPNSSRIRNLKHKIKIKNSL